MKKQITIKDLAGVLGLTERRISQLVTDGKLPAPVAGKFDLGRSVRAYIAFVKSASGGHSLQQARINKLAVEQRLLELDLKERRGELINLHHVAESLCAFTVSARDFIWSRQELDEDLRRDILAKLQEIFHGGFSAVGKKYEDYDPAAPSNREDGVD